MDLDFEELIISEEQAHSFALSIFNDVKNYFLDFEKYINSIFEISSNLIQSIDGVFILADNIYNYSHCNY